MDSPTYAIPSLRPGRPLGAREYLGHCRCERRPRRRFFSELLTSARRDPVVLSLPVVLGETPARFHEAALLEAVQGGIERAFLDAQRIVGHVLQPPRDAVTVRRSPRNGLEDEHIKRALQELHPIRIRCHNSRPSRG